MRIPTKKLLTPKIKCFSIKEQIIFLFFMRKSVFWEILEFYCRYLYLGKGTGSDGVYLFYRMIFCKNCHTLVQLSVLMILNE